MTSPILAALGGFCGGLGVALLLSRSLRKSITEARLRSVTRILFVASMTAAICWVSCSYIIAGYATVFLGQPFPVEDLSDRAITALLGVNAMKVLENLFEHNDGGLFGKTNKKTGGDTADRDY